MGVTRNTNELRVFISSTFRDLQEEREHLVKKIFPEIRALCRERGITFTEVDLRWGLTEEEAMLGRIIRTCLEEIDKCRPYFVGMIGNRYGWAPQLHEVMIDPDLLAKYPWIEDVVIDGASVTEIEFIHGVFNAPQVDGEYAFFYHRQSDISEADDPERLSALILRAQATDHPFHEFASTDELGRLVHDDLVGMIDRYWPQSKVPTALELERRSHTAFSASRTRAYIPNPEHLKSFTAWSSGGASPLVISGESGLGKSSLAAYLVESYRKKHPSALVIEYYVGASQSSGSAASVVRFIVEEIRERYAIDDPVPSNDGQLIWSFPNWLFRCERLASNAGIPVLILIDAVNQLNESSRQLSWLPTVIPTGLKLLISTTPGQIEEYLVKRGWEQLVVTPLYREGIRQSIVLRYLGEFHKAISVDQLRRITSDPKANSPLYLRVVSEELRLHGDHETIDGVIACYTRPADLSEVFESVLERMENDYGEPAVRSLLSLIAASNSGLNETQLMELTGTNRLNLSRLLFALDYHLIHRDGQLSFFHEYLRQAVEKRYLFEEPLQRAAHTRLIEYFEQQEAGVHISRELVWQLAAVDDKARLATILSTMPHFMALYQSGWKYNVLIYWSQLREVADMESLMNDGIDRQRSGRWDDREAVEVLGAAADLFMQIGRLDIAARHLRECLHIAQSLGDTALQTKARRVLGEALFRQGDMASAMEESLAARGLCELHGDRRELSLTLAQLATLCIHAGDITHGFEYAHEHERLCEELVDRHGLMLSYANLADCYLKQDDYEKSLQYYHKGLEICNERGDRQIAAYMIGNMGLVYACVGQFDSAMECYEKDRDVCEQLGDRSGISVASGNIGELYLSMGEFDLALMATQRQLEICQEIGDTLGKFQATGNLGNVYQLQGEFDRALECYQQALQGHRAVGYRVGLTHWLEGTTSTLLTLLDRAAEATVTHSHDAHMPAYLPSYVPDAANETWQVSSLRTARANAEECVAISEELMKQDTLFLGNVLLARIDAAESGNAAAQQRLSRMLPNVNLDEQSAELQYWLWRIGGTEAGEEHRVDALRLYQSLIEKTPKYIYRKRIDELTAATNPSESSSIAE